MRKKGYSPKYLLELYKDLFVAKFTLFSRLREESNLHAALIMVTAATIMAAITAYII
jgi:hypothetical protein